MGKDLPPAVQLVILRFTNPQAADDERDRGDEDRVQQASVDRVPPEGGLGAHAEVVTAVAISGRNPPNQPFPRWYGSDMEV